MRVQIFKSRRLAGLGIALSLALGTAHADDHPLSMALAPERCLLDLSLLNPASSFSEAKPLDDQSAPRKGLWQQLVALIHRAPKAGTRVIEPETPTPKETPETKEAIVESPEYIFVRILPDAIKRLRDILSASEVNQILNLAVSTFAETAQEIYPELQDQMNGKMVSEFSYLLLPIRRGQISWTQLRSLHEEANGKFRELLALIAPKAYQELANYKGKEDFPIFLVGSGDTPQQAKVAASLSRFDDDQSPNFKDAKPVLISNFLALRSTLNSLGIVFSTQEIATLVRKSENSYELMAELLHMGFNETEAAKLSQELHRLSQLVSIFSFPPQSTENFEAFDENHSSRFLLSFDVEGAGANILLETLIKLEWIHYDPDSEVRDFSQVIEKLDPVVARSSLEKKLRDIRRIVKWELKRILTDLTKVQDLDESSYTPNAWQTGDEILIALPDSFSSQDAEAVMEKITQETGLKNLRGSLIDMQIDGTQMVNKDHHDILRDLSEKFQKLLKSLFTESQKEEIRFWVEMRITGDQIQMIIHPQSKETADLIDQVIAENSLEVRGFFEIEREKLHHLDIEVLTVPPHEEGLF